MKKLLTLFLAFLCAFSLFACGEDPPTACAEHTDANSDGKCDKCDAEIPPEEDPGEKPADYILIENGKAKFQIVTATTALGGSTLKKAVDGLADALRDLDVEVESVTESADNVKACEVIIGVPTTRGDAYDYDIHTLGYEGYAIKLIDGRVVILGGSEAALVTAIDVFTEEFLGIDKKTKELDTVVVKSTQWVEQIQDDYRITALKLDGEDMKGYTIATNASNVTAKKIAETVQLALYQKSGYWLPIVPLSEADKSIVVNLKENTYEGNGFYVDVKNGQLVIECEFANKFEQQVTSFLAKTVTVAGGELDFTSKKHKTSVNVRDIYYEEFGAKGNGSADDYKAIKDTHDYANEWGHTVKGKSTATYYIGNTDNKSISIKTDTDWQGCGFIFDDTQVDYTSKGREMPVFDILPNGTFSTVINKSNFAHVTPDSPWIDEGDNITTNIGWAPGKACIIRVVSYEHKNYVRYGANETAGESQEDTFIVDAEGNIDPSTPLMWSFTQINEVYMYSLDQRPITVGHAKVHLLHNDGPSEYYYYERGIRIRRSYATLTDIYLTIDDERSEHGCPYTGIVTVDRCANATVDNYSFKMPKNFYTATSTSSNVVMGSYALSAGRSLNVTFKNINQYDMFDENGMIRSKATMGSNYCKNLMLEDSLMSLYDAHRGAYNVSAKNSRVGCLNMIGEGLIYLENVTLLGGDYSSPRSLGLRYDYGATWKGDVKLIDCTIELIKNSEFSLFYSSQYVPDWDFGYTCYFPQNIYIEGLKCTKSGAKIYLAKFLHDTEKKFGGDISIPKSEGGAGGINPYIGTKTLTIVDTDFDIILPDLLMFKDMKVTIDGNLVPDWRSLYGHKVSDKQA